MCMYIYIHINIYFYLTLYTYALFFTPIFIIVFFSFLFLATGGVGRSPSEIRSKEIEIPIGKLFVLFVCLVGCLVFFYLFLTFCRYCFIYKGYYTCRQDKRY